MFRNILAAGAAAATLALAGQASATVTFEFARAQVKTHYEMMDQFDVVSGDADLSDEGDSLRDFSATLPVDATFARAGGGDPSSVVTGAATTTFDFTGAERGVMTATGGFTVTNGYADSFGMGAYGYIFQYVFTVDQNSRLDLSWINGERMFLFEDGQGLTDGSIYGDGQSSWSLTAGKQYHLGLYDGFGFGGNSTVQQTGAGTNTGTIEHRFEFAIAAPEPSTWALMIGGFGLAGASLRRRRAMA